MRDIGPSDWLLLVEDEGPTGLGRVLAYVVLESQIEAETMEARGVRSVCHSLGLFDGEEIPDDVCLEAMSIEDFRGSYGDRMPLHNRIDYEEF